MFVERILFPVLVAGVLVACGSEEHLSSEAKGTLAITVNGEDFVRDGFTSEDGWEIAFDHFYVHLAGITAYQVPVTDIGKSRWQPAHAGHDHGELPTGTAHITKPQSVVVDIAAGNSATQVSSDTAAPVGNYNYLNVDLTPAIAAAENAVDDYLGDSMVMLGQASKGATTVEFEIRLQDVFSFRECGPVLGAVVAAGGNGTAEFTLHIDHLFGDFETLGHEHSVNDIAVGFDPFFALADTGSTPIVLELDQSAMESRMNAGAYAGFLEALQTIGHSGEEHCATGVRNP